MTPTQCRNPAAAGGFSLLELLVVSGVLAVLLGLAVGFLGKTDPYAVAEATLRGELRAAQFTARAEGLPTEVLVEPGTDTAPVATVRSRLLEPVATFHCEPGELVLEEYLRGQYGGQDAPGRFGRGRRSDGGDKQPALRWAAPPPLVDLHDGFALRIELYLERRQSCTVLRCGGWCELALDGACRPRARLQLDGGTALASAVATLAGDVALPIARWCTLDFAADGRECWLAIDGREVARGPAGGAPQQGASDVLDVSPGDDPVPGVVDEIRVLAYALGPLQYLPPELQPDRPHRIAFDARGKAVTATAVAWQEPGEQP
jgi:prepilin-type N-terminal cleavage/methylation domain-containing protein